MSDPTGIIKFMRDAQSRNRANIVEVRDKHLRETGREPTIRHVAERTGLSHCTVSIHLRGIRGGVFDSHPRVVADAHARLTARLGRSPCLQEVIRESGLGRRAVATHLIRSNLPLGAHQPFIDVTGIDTRIIEARAERLRAHEPPPEPEPIDITKEAKADYWRAWRRIRRRKSA